MGAGSGIGRATAKAFAEQGYRLGLGDLSEEGLEQTKQILEPINSQIWTGKVNASDCKEVELFVEEACNFMGEVTTLVYAAGMGRFCPIIDMSPEQWNLEIAVDLNGAFYCAQAVARKMITQRKGGCLLFLSSTGATHAANKLAPYCTAKAGINMLIKCLANELGNYRIRANAAMPGVTETNMTKPMLALDRYKNMLRTTIPLGNWAQAEDVASLLLFLASDEARFINGQAIAVCGGHSARPSIDWWPLDYSQDFECDWQGPLKQFPFIKEKEK